MVKFLTIVFVQVYARMSEVLGITDDNHVLETFMTKMWVPALVFYFYFVGGGLTLIDLLLCLNLFININFLNKRL